MAWNPSPEVADCREIARKWKCDQVIVLAIDNKTGTFKTVSYGESRALCDSAKKINEQIHKEVERGIIEVNTEAS